MIRILTRRLGRIPRPPRRARLATASVALVALLGGLLVSGIHDAYPTTRVLQSSGLAWVTSDQIGALTLLDGVAGQPVVDVTAAQADGDPLLAGQQGTTGYALDQASGLLTRADGSSYATTTGVEPSTGSGTTLRFLVGTHTAYVVDDADSTVSAYDLATLLQSGGPLAFAQGASITTAVVDASGRLWILDERTGRLTWFTGKATGTGAESFSPGGASLLLADGEPVVVDRGTHRASLISADGSVAARLDLGADGAAPGTGYSGPTTQTALLTTDSARDTYQSCIFTADPARDACGETRHAEFGGDTLGPAVIADGTAYVPDYTTGTAWVLDPGRATPPVHTAPLTAPGEFDLFDRSGLIFYNDPDTSQAGTIAPDGTTKPIVKYGAATAAGNPGASASAGGSAPPAATPSISTLLSPSAAAPSSRSGPQPTAAPTPAGPGVTRSPSPSPYPSGGSPTYCTTTSSNTSQSLSVQGDTPLSDSEKPAGEGTDPGKRRRIGPDNKAAYIGAAAAIIAAIISLTPSITSSIHSWLSSPSSEPGISSPTATAVAAATATHSTSQAVGAPMPAGPEFTIQNPDQGRGVYGVEFMSNSSLAVGDLNGSVYLWNLDNATNTAVLPDKSGQQIFGLGYDPQQQLLAASTFNNDYSAGSVVLWNASTHAYVTTLTTPDGTGFGNPAVFSPNGDTLAADGNDNDIYLWDTTKNFKPIGTPFKDPGGDGDFGLAFSPSTGYLAAGDANGTAYLWDIQNGHLVQTFLDTPSGHVVSVAFSSDGSILATGDSAGDVDLWDVASGALITTLHGAKGTNVESIAFSPTKPILAATLTASNASEFCVWNTAGKLLGARKDPGTTINTKIAFSPDGNTLAVGDENVKTYIWNMTGVG